MGSESNGSSGDDVSVGGASELEDARNAGSFRRRLGRAMDIEMSDAHPREVIVRVAVPIAMLRV